MRTRQIFAGPPARTLRESRRIGRGVANTGGRPSRQVFLVLLPFQKFLEELLLSLSIRLWWRFRLFRSVAGNGWATGIRRAHRCDFSATLMFWAARVESSGALRLLQPTAVSVPRSPDLKTARAREFQ